MTREDFDFNLFRKGDKILYNDRELDIITINFNDYSFEVDVPFNLLTVRTIVDCENCVYIPYAIDLDAAFDSKFPTKLDFFEQIKAITDDYNNKILNPKN